MLQNIRAYSNSVAVVYVVDNSEDAAARGNSKPDVPANVTYIHSGGNLGIARALNMAAERAIQEGYAYLLTMDQDSKAPDTMIERLLSCLRVFDPSTIGIISPVHQVENAPLVHTEPCKEVSSVMTSGNLLNLEAYRAAGPFLEDLFIDEVDHEYCLRLQARGYKVVQSGLAVLEHALGRFKVHIVGGRRYLISNHAAIRRYYMTRNRLYVMNRYKKQFPALCRERMHILLHDLLGIVFFESDKINKLTMAWKGYRHYRSNKLGKLE